VPIATTEEQLALCASLREWAKSTGPIGLVRQLESSDPAVPCPAAGPSPASAPGTSAPPTPPGQDYCLSLADGAAANAVHEFLLTRCLSIAGGTSQILLSMVAERVLGLPRDEVR
jgi:hypothetical protein